MGGIKATARNEAILDPALTAKMLSPMASTNFAQRVSELGYLYGATPLGGYMNSSIGTQYNGGVYNIGGISMTAEQAKQTTVYELAKLSRNLRAYNAVG